MAICHLAGKKGNRKYLWKITQSHKKKEELDELLFFYVQFSVLHLVNNLDFKHFIPVLTCYKECICFGVVRNTV